jgi:hypothetical protein
VHVIPAPSRDEFEEKRSAFLDAHGTSPRDLFVSVHGFTQTEPFSTGMTMLDLLDHIAKNGRRLYDPETA